MTSLVKNVKEADADSFIGDLLREMDVDRWHMQHANMQHVSCNTRLGARWTRTGGALSCYMLHLARCMLARCMLQHAALHT